jgi:hypothetical protein
VRVARISVAGRPPRVFGLDLRDNTDDLPRPRNWLSRRVDHADANADRIPAGVAAHERPADKADGRGSGIALRERVPRDRGKIQRREVTRIRRLKSATRTIALGDWRIADNPNRCGPISPRHTATMSSIRCSAHPAVSSRRDRSELQQRLRRSDMSPAQRWQAEVERQHAIAVRAISGS